MYTIGFSAFQSVFFATIYSNSSYFISGFGAGNIYNVKYHVYLSIYLIM